MPATLSKKRFWVCSCEFCEIFKNTFYTQHLRATAYEDAVYRNDSLETSAIEFNNTNKSGYYSQQFQ